MPLKGPEAFLRHYCGHLHADAYSGYDGIFLESDHHRIEEAQQKQASKKLKRARRRQARRDPRR